MIPAQFKVDIFSEIERICNFNYGLYVVDRTIDELNKLKEGKGREAANARLALNLIKFKKIKMIGAGKEGYADDIIVDVSDGNAIVATQDKLLKKRLKEKGIPVITLRQKSHLILY